MSMEPEENLEQASETAAEEAVEIVEEAQEELQEQDAQESAQEEAQAEETGEDDEPADDAEEDVEEPAEDAEEESDEPAEDAEENSEDEPSPLITEDMVDKELAEKALVQAGLDVDKKEAEDALMCSDEPGSGIAVIGPDELVAEGGMGQHSVAKKKGHALRNAIIAIVVVLVLAVGGCCGYLAWDDANSKNYVPENTTLDGKTDISGMSRNEVKSAVESHMRNGVLPNITVKANGEELTLRYTAVGDVDVDATVEEAFSLRNPSTLKRWYHRAKQIIGMEEPAAKEVYSVCSIDSERLQARVTELANQANCDPQDAGYAFDDEKGKVITTEASTGFKMNVEKTVAAIEEACQSGGEEVVVEAVGKTTKPENTELGQCIYVDTVGCQLYFYEGGKLKKQYPCSPGQSGYLTPTGDFTITQKDASPSWYNPNSSWSKNMPKSIGPGPNNPLGLRAMALSCGGGIYIHGTTKYYRLGNRDSHGCIRLGNDQVVELFDMVEVGIPVFVR